MDAILTTYLETISHIVPAIILEPSDLILIVSILFLVVCWLTWKVGKRIDFERL